MRVSYSATNCFFDVTNHTLTPNNTFILAKKSQISLCNTDLSHLKSIHIDSSTLVSLSEEIIVTLSKETSNVSFYNTSHLLKIHQLTIDQLDFHSIAIHHSKHSIMAVACKTCIRIYDKLLSNNLDYVEAGIDGIIIQMRFLYSYDEVLLCVAVLR